MRGSIPFWTANPNIESSLLNVHGIAHKIVLEGDFSASEANQNMTNLAQYNPLQDDAQEFFQRRFASETYGGTTPMQRDTRFKSSFLAMLRSWSARPSVWLKMM